jgi:hypothetical protein
MIKIPPCLKALSAEYRPKFKFAALSPAMVTDTRQLKICSSGYKQTNKQTKALPNVVPLYSMGHDFDKLNSRKCKKASV